MICSGNLSSLAVIGRAKLDPLLHDVDPAILFLVEAFTEPCSVLLSHSDPVAEHLDLLRINFVEFVHRTEIAH